jgi:hypothetical protein
MEQKSNAVQQLKNGLIAAGIAALIAITAKSGSFLYSVEPEMQEVDRQLDLEERQLDLHLSRYQAEIAEVDQATARADQREDLLFGSNKEELWGQSISKNFSKTCDLQLPQIATDVGRFQPEAISASDMAASLMTAVSRFVNAERALWQVACDPTKRKSATFEYEMRSAMGELKAAIQSVRAAQARVDFEKQLYALNGRTRISQIRIHTSELRRDSTISLAAILFSFIAFWIIYKLITGRRNESESQEIPKNISNDAPIPVAIAVSEKSK